MFGYSPKSAARAYSKMDMETGVLTADPHKLIVMLFDGAIIAIVNGTQQIQTGKVAEKDKSIAHAIAIIEHGLRASLNREVGGELAHNLDTLYIYMVRQLIIANVKNDVNKLNEVKTLLTDLRSAWEQIAPNKSDQADQVESLNKAQPQDALAPRKSSYISA